MLNIDGGTVVAAVSSVVALSSGAVALYVRATRAELVAQMEHARTEIITHINTSYVRKEHCALREEGMKDLLAAMRREFGLGE